MTQPHNSLQDLDTLFEVGFSVQAVVAFFSFCLTHQKTEELKKLRELIESSVASFTPQERKQLQEDMDAILREKANSFLDELEVTHSQEEIDQLVNDLQGSSTT